MDTSTEERKMLGKLTLLGIAAVLTYHVAFPVIVTAGRLLTSVADVVAAAGGSI